MKTNAHNTGGKTAEEIGFADSLNDAICKLTNRIFISIIFQMNYFTCKPCNKRDHVELVRHPVGVHFSITTSELYIIPHITNWTQFNVNENSDKWQTEIYIFLYNRLKLMTSN